MAETIIISLYQVVGSEFCVASDDGAHVYEQIAKAFERGAFVELSFRNVKRLTSAFLNVAIGQLYGEYTEDFIKRHLSVSSDIGPADATLLKRVVDQAKRFFQSPDAYNKAYHAVMG